MDQLRMLHAAIGQAVDRSARDGSTCRVYRDLKTSPPTWYVCDAEQREEPAHGSRLVGSAHNGQWSEEPVGTIYSRVAPKSFD